MRDIFQLCLLLIQWPRCSRRQLVQVFPTFTHLQCPQLLLSLHREQSKKSLQSETGFSGKVKAWQVADWVNWLASGGVEFDSRFGRSLVDLLLMVAVLRLCDMYYWYVCYSCSRLAVLVDNLCKCFQFSHIWSADSYPCRYTRAIRGRLKVGNRLAPFIHACFSWISWIIRRGHSCTIGIHYFPRKYVKK